ncbi:MAG: CCA tRNA nucleotidyltransferase [Phycisphaerales bacterium]|nr:CCA tRNA nucleotidyltransferase [Phycisphaerales bacterium]
MSAHANNLDAASRDARREAMRIIGILREHGHEAYFAGGCVRDELLGLSPKDYDIATDASPDRVHELFPRAQAVGKAFGVMHVRARRGREKPPIVTEIATFRKDSVYSDKRRPDTVTFADAKEDALRRDFTINALFLDPTADATDVPAGGRVIDYVRGVADLRAGIVRAVGNAEARLAEDHLRALRAVRFAARFGFAIEAETAAAIRAHARELQGVSEERVGDELRRMFAHPKRSVAAALLEALGLAEAALGEQAPVASGAALLDLLPPTVATAVAMAAWALDRGGSARPAPVGEVAILADTIPGRWRRAMKLSNDETDRLRATLAGVVHLERDWEGAGIAARKRMAASDWFDDAMMLLAGRDGQRESAQALRPAIELVVEALRGSFGGLNPIPLITGEDLIREGLRPGPDFKRCLEAAYDAQLEGRATTREEALRVAMGGQ